jgi:hypothetical protein
MHFVGFIIRTNRILTPVMVVVIIRDLEATFCEATQANSHAFIQ